MIARHNFSLFLDIPSLAILKSCKRSFMPHAVAITPRPLICCLVRTLLHALYWLLRVRLLLLLLISGIEVCEPWVPKRLLC